MNSSRVMKIAILILGVATLTARLEARAQQGALDGQVLHILVGKSVIVNVETPITRVLSSNPGIIGTLATSPTQVVVEGKAAGSSSLIVWDETGRSQMLDVVVDVDIAGLRSTIEHSYPNQHVEVEATGGRLMLSGSVSTPQMIDELTKMAGLYSTQVVSSLSVNERQVLLEVKFAEVDRTAISQFGINLLSTGAGNTIGTTTTGQFGQTGTQTITDSIGVKANPAPDSPIPSTGSTHIPFTSTETLNQVLNIFLFNPAIHLGATVQALQQKNVLQVLAEPNLMAINGQKASFLAGGEFPFPVIQPGSGTTSVTIQFKPFGVKLDFTGLIQNDNSIRLHVAPEVSTLDFSNALTISGFVIPAISTRRAETEIELKDGQSFGIAGLLDNRATVQMSKVPGLGDLPVLGQFFRSHSTNKSHTELLVLVTVHIVDPLHMAEATIPEPKLAVPFMESPKFDKNMPGNKTESAPQAPSSK
jgi:pilus assembly protein CpaC